MRRILREKSLLPDDLIDRSKIRFNISKNRSKLYCRSKIINKNNNPYAMKDQCEINDKVFSKSSLGTIISYYSSNGEKHSVFTANLLRDEMIKCGPNYLLNNSIKLEN